MDGGCLSHKGSHPNKLAAGFRLFLTAALLVFLLAVKFNPSHAAPAAPLAPGQTYVVNSTIDAPDTDPSDGVCATVDGACTLRAAIMQANFATQPVTITLPAGLYRLTRVGSDDNALVGDLDIRGDLTIQGAGSGLTTVDGNSALTHDRVFKILPSASRVRLSGMTIRDGAATMESSPPAQMGGGIYRDGGSSSSTTPSLTLSEMILEGNSAQDGGGLYLKSGQLELDHTRIRANSATNSGGGFYADGSLLTVRDSLVYSNSAYTGGGLWLSDISEGLIQRSQIYSNTVSGYGGGLSNSASNANPSSQVTLEDSSLHDNHATYNGGAIDNYASLVISHTLLEANSAGTYGGGLMMYQAYVPSTIRIIRSTLSHNTAQYGAGIFYNDFVGQGSTMTVLNSTLSGNSASHSGGGLYAIGQARVYLYNATIAGNQVRRFFTQHYTIHGGGLVITTTAVITAQNSLIGNNVLTNGLTIPTPEDCYGSLHSLGNNLVEDTTNCAISGTIYGNVMGQDPQLGPLQNNGGSILTLALLSGSPAIDSGANSACPATDQRGVRRPFDGDGNGSAICDMGAYEAASHLSQSIDFASIADKRLNDATFVITATASSGLTVDFNASPPDVCSVSGSSLFAGVSSATVTLKETGNCALVAQQPGDSTFNPAAPVTQTFSVLLNLFLPVVVR
jgi:CSLREA domain-containing protein